MPSHLLRRAVAFTATTAAVCALALTSATTASAAVVTTPISDSAAGAAISLSPIGADNTGVYKKSAAEIVQAYRDTLFVVNAQNGSVSVLDNSDPTKPEKKFEISSTGVANSVTVREDGLGIIAFEATTKTAPGHLVFFNAAATSAQTAVLGTVEVGALPDMVTVSKDGKYAVVANEGEPSVDFTVDPEGSVSVVTLPSGVAAPAQSAVKTANFRAFEPGGTKTLDPKVRVFGPDVAAPGQDPTTLATNRVSRNLEPEYVTVEGSTAYVTLQEANAIAVIDLAKAETTSILPLGYKDYGKAGNGIDASDRASAINIQTYPGLKGVYMPDAIASYSATASGTSAAATYLVTANEGDGREWGSFIDEARIKDLGKNGLGAICADSPILTTPNAVTDNVLGRLKIITDLGKTDAGCYSELYSYGGRSFSIWDTKGVQVFDSGDQFEQITARLAAEGKLTFNASNDNQTRKDRSDDKGPEPEGVAIGTVNGKTYAFIGLERVGGVMVFDITDPKNATYVTYVNNRDFAATTNTGEVTNPAVGDLGPEGLTFIPALRSPNGKPLLAVGNEVSGTTTVFQIDDKLPHTPDVQILTINDFHGRIVTEASNGYAGAAALAGAVQNYRENNPNTLFVSAGDNIGASAFESFINQDNPTIDALAAASLDVSAVGNHEFDQGYADIIDRVIPGFGGPQYALAANVYKKDGTAALKPYTVETTPSGARIAFIGVVTPETATLVNPAGVKDLTFGDMTVAVNREAAKIAASNEADVVVVLAHDGNAASNCTAVQNDTATDFGKLVHNASGNVDAIVSAHTHQKYACEVGGRPVIQANQYGTTLGTLDIDLNDDKSLASIRPGLVPLYDAAVSATAAYPDPTVAPIVAKAKADADVKGAVEVGTISADILRGKSPGVADDRGLHSSLGNTVSDVYLWATSQNPNYGGKPAQIAFMNPGGLRADLLYGTNGSVSYRAAANVQPFGNTLVTLELTGAQIKSVLEEQWQPANAARPKLALGVSIGFTFSYDPAAAKGSHITSMQLDGRTIPLDSTEKFRVTTNSFLAAGGDNFTTFAQGTGTADSGQIDLQATADYFDAIIGAVKPAAADRAYLAGAQPPVEERPEFEQPPVDPEPSPEPTTEPTIEPTVEPTTSPSPSPSSTLPATGADWADWALSNGGTVEQGGTLTVTLSGLTPGQQVSATLFSDPIVVTGIPAANAAGSVTFAVKIPSNLELGAHRLVISSAGLTDITIPVTVVRPGALAATGAELPWGLALGGAFLLVAGGLAFALRRRRSVEV